MEIKIQPTSESSVVQFAVKSEGESAPIPRYLEILNEEQRRAALHILGPSLVLAGAGSGKTRMLVARMLYLIQECGVAPHRIMAVTFTNKAAREMKERLLKGLDTNDIRALPEVGTFHSICARLLRQFARLLPFDKPFVIFDDSDQLTVLKLVFRRMNLDESKLTPKWAQYAISAAKSDGINANSFVPNPYRPNDQLLSKIYLAYEAALRAQNALDFDDLILKTYELLRDHSDVRSVLQRRLEFVHVDEYQDTNRLQYLLLRELASPERGSHGNLCVVGDEDQSIYKWRGADIRNILEFERDFANAAVFKLEQNYRSTRSILEAAQAVVSRNIQRKHKKLWTENSVGERIQVVECDDDREEARFVVRQCQRLALDRGRSYRDMAIFYRTHAQSRAFEDELRRQKIAYEIIGGLRFYDRKEIKDMMAYLRVLINPKDSVSLARIINVPARGIGKTTLDSLMNSGAPSLYEALIRLREGTLGVELRSAKKLVLFLSQLESWIEFAQNNSVSEIYRQVVHDTQYVLDLKKQGTDEALDRINNLEEFDNVIEDFEQSLSIEDASLQGESALLRFIEQSSLSTEVPSVDGTQVTGVLRLMTLHSSKGLEFPHVFMVGVEDGLFPSLRNGEKEDPENIEEERRLCYVGMTRAEQTLLLSHAKTRRIWGQIQLQYPSRFLEEIPSEYVEEVSIAHEVPSSVSLSPVWGTGYRSTSTVSTQKQRGSERQNQGFSKSMISSSNLVRREVWHPTYGKGFICECDGNAPGSHVMIQFDGNVQRKFLRKFVEGWLVEIYDEGEM